MRPSTAALAVAALIAIQALVLYAMGQPPICTCGTVKLWEGVVRSSGNSQHVADWYTPSHVIHGILFYALLRILAPRLPVGVCLLLAVSIEIGWEIFENTDFVIKRYREQALAQGYNGDSILNSVMDVVAMLVGFSVAAYAPTWAAAALVIALELFVGIAIRDNLTLNIINLLYPLDVIAKWQGGA